MKSLKCLDIIQVVLELIKINKLLLEQFYLDNIIYLFVLLLKVINLFDIKASNGSYYDEG